MPENNKTQEFLKKLAPCIERGELDACVEEAARVAQEMSVGAGDLLELSKEERRNDKYHFSYMIALAAAQVLEGEAKAQAYSNAGLALQCAENIQKAEEYYQKAIDIDPKYAEAHSNYAYFLKENAMFFEAEKDVRIALQIEPDDPYDLRTYGDILADEDYLEDAIKKYHGAIKNSDSMEHPEKAEIHNNLGWVYAHLEQYNRAKKEFEEAYKLDPHNVKVIRTQICCSGTIFISGFNRYKSKKQSFLCALYDEK